MSLKKKLGLGVASAALGLSLVGGGTYAYFSDSVTTSNTFATGTLDLATDPTTIVEVTNIKPRDTITRTFKLQNKGTLDISKVKLNSTYEVIDAKLNNKANTEDFGKHIKVEFLYNKDKGETIVYNTTLDKLTSNPDVVENDFWDIIFGGEYGIKTGTTDTLKVKFVFEDNNKDQNDFQGDSLKLNWTFNAEQTAGESK
ncbi:TasA family protein [Fictibacillus phosphorivorans]|jgi:spore coat-associated protein N|uniref:TasA family protein n=1 Tax=Fictibacillus phosphorivorans TaxID=1221500 RepID=UPI0012933F60|nr:TasA family protein [Fictibacillus phosphorivorans]MQR94606.1 cell division protein FtsN [Fictibacillus phosphorivorans]